ASLGNAAHDIGVLLAHDDGHGGRRREGPDDLLGRAEQTRPRASVRHEHETDDWGASVAVTQARHRLSLPRSRGTAPLDVAVADRNRELPTEAPSQLLGDGHRAVAAPRTPDGDGRVRLALALEARDGHRDELLGLLDEGLRLGIVEDEVRHGLVLA